MAWKIILASEVEEWFLDLDEPLSNQIRDCIELLADRGPDLGRPYVDRIEGSAIHNLKELRPRTNRHHQIRILFVFDPRRQAILLVAGNKVGHWSHCRYALYLGIDPEEIT